jgi:methionyl aminopeptidase
VPNWGEAGKGIVMRPGLVIAIEPMVTQGSYDVETLKDGWTVVTADGKLAAHFEHTVALTDDGPRILTLREHDFMELDVAKYRPKEELAA